MLQKPLVRWSKKEQAVEKPVTWQGTRAGSVNTHLSILITTPDFQKCLPHVKNSCTTFGVALKKVSAIEQITRHAYNQQDEAGRNGCGKFTKDGLFFRFIDGDALLCVVKKKRLPRTPNGPVSTADTIVKKLASDKSSGLGCADAPRGVEAKLAVDTPLTGLHIDRGLDTSMGLRKGVPSVTPGLKLNAYNLHFSGCLEDGNTKCNKRIKMNNEVTSLATLAVCPTNPLIDSFGAHPAPPNPKSTVINANATAPIFSSTRGGSSSFSIATNGHIDVGAAPDAYAYPSFVQNAVQGTKRR
jgi:hypothetical protein